VGNIHPACIGAEVEGGSGAGTSPAAACTGTEEAGRPFQRQMLPGIYEAECEIVIGHWAENVALIVAETPVVPRSPPEYARNRN